MDKISNEEVKSKDLLEKKLGQQEELEEKEQLLA
jgi:hypothetical protein